MESLKIAVLGFLLYFVSVPAFFTAEEKLFGKVEKSDDRPRILRRKFWKSFWLVIVSIALILAIQCFFFNVAFTTKHRFQVAGVFIALTASLGRGGWDIQSWDGHTAIERIDRGMYVISQLGATAILLFVLIF